MKRRSFLKSVLGFLGLVFLPKAKGKEIPTKTLEKANPEKISKIAAGQFYQHKEGKITLDLGFMPDYFSAFTDEEGVVTWYAIKV